MKTDQNFRDWKSGDTLRIIGKEELFIARTIGTHHAWYHLNDFNSHCIGEPCINIMHVNFAPMEILERVTDDVPMVLDTEN